MRGIVLADDAGIIPHGDDTEPPIGRVQHVTARDLSAATLGGIGAGTVVGLLARVDMRVVALIRQVPTELSLFGSAGIVITFVLMALGLATGFTWWRRGSSAAGAAPAARWSLAGVALFTAVILVTPLRQELAAPAELLLFVPVALLLGAAPAWLSQIARRWLPEARTARARVGYRVLAVPAILATLVLPLMLVAGVLQVLGVIPVPTE